MSPEPTTEPTREPTPSLQRLLATWQAWNSRDVLAQAAARAASTGDTERAAALQALLEAQQAPSATPSATPLATEALAAQHELASRLGGWQWQTVAAARAEGAGWDDIAAATGTTPDEAEFAHTVALERAEQATTAAGLAFDHARYRAPDTDSERDDTTSHDDADADSDSDLGDAGAGETLMTDPTDPTPPAATDTEPHADAAGAVWATPDPTLPPGQLSERELIARAEYCDEIAHTESPADRAAALRDLDAAWDEAERRAQGQPAVSIPAQVAGYIGLVREDYDHALAAETATWRRQLDAALPRETEAETGELGPAGDDLARQERDMREALLDATPMQRMVNRAIFARGMAALRAQVRGRDDLELSEDSLWAPVAAWPDIRLTRHSEHGPDEYRGHPTMLRAYLNQAENIQNTQNTEHSERSNPASPSLEQRADRAQSLAQGAGVDAAGYDADTDVYTDPDTAEVVRPDGHPSGPPSSRGREQRVPEDATGGDWDAASQIADRDGYVVFDPTVAGGFRALSADERAALLDGARAGWPSSWTGDEHEAYLDARPDASTRYNPAAEYGDSDWREPASDDEAAARTTWLAQNTAPAPGWQPRPPTEVEDALQDAQERAVLSDRAHDSDPYAWAEYHRLQALDELAPIPERDALDELPRGEHGAPNITAKPALSRDDDTVLADADGPDRVRARLEDARARLAARDAGIGSARGTGPGVDAGTDEQQRREQLARWYDDDRASAPAEAGDTTAGHGGEGDDGAAGWYR